MSIIELERADAECVWTKLIMKSLKVANDGGEIIECYKLSYV